MSAQIRYAYLKQQTWLYRRNYPRDVAIVLGSQALKQSLKTSDRNVARARAAEVNARFETLVAKVRSGAAEALAGSPEWEGDPEDALARLRSSLAHSGSVPTEFSRLVTPPKIKVADVARQYLRKRGCELRPGGYKSVRYSVGLFVSKFGDRQLTSLSRDDGREFLRLVAQLSPLLGRSRRTQGLGLEQSVAVSERLGGRITPQTQKRIWSQVKHFLDWVVYEGHLETNPFQTVLFDQKLRPAPYAVLTDDEVQALLAERDGLLHDVLLTCLLSGMRAGEAVGLLREDLVQKGNLGWFVNVRPNRLRLLKTDAAERLVPVHPVLDEVFRKLPPEGPLFPGLSVNQVTKRFTELRQRLDLERPGLVFHSSRKWFITQCERTGAPEHFTASLVGHKSARSENGITYGIYSAGISDEQQRSIVDQIRLPE